jgi:sugar lactone lactonase YvrE
MSVPASTSGYSGAVFEPVEGWGALPDRSGWGGDATAVAVDSQDRVYLFNRGPVPMIVMDPAGSLLESWGEGEFGAPHGIAIDGAGDLYLVDSGGSYLGDGGHVVEKRTRSGELVFRLGSHRSPSRAESGDPFNGPTDIAVHPHSGELFVTDGYGNGRVHRFSPEGELIMSWGKTGTRPGEFNLPHGIDFLDDDHLIVCDRENFRLQIFTLDGDFVDQWHAHHPGGVRKTSDGVLYVAELGPISYRWGLPNLGCRVRLLTIEGVELTRFGDEHPGAGTGQFIAPHALAIDSSGDVYVAETSRGWLTYVGDEPPADKEPPSLRKWRRVADTTARR